MPSAGLCVRSLLYLTLIIYCPENVIIIFIKKVFRVTEYRFWLTGTRCHPYDNHIYFLSMPLMGCSRLIIGEGSHGSNPQLAAQRVSECGLSYILYLLNSIYQNILYLSHF